MAGRIPKVVVIGPAFVDMAIKCGQFPQPGETVEGAAEEPLKTDRALMAGGRPFMNPPCHNGRLDPDWGV